MNSDLVKLEAEERAKALKAERREEFDDFGLMDAIILVSLWESESELLTGDPHLEDEDNNLPLES